MRKVFLVLACLVAVLTSGIAQADSSSSEDDSNQGILLNSNTVSVEQLLNFKAPREAESLTGQELVDYVNRHQNLWTAKLSEKFSSYDESVKWKIMGVNNVKNSIEARKTLAKSRYLDIELPTNFDSREHWPSCQSIKAIRDQSSCGSCWAFGAVEAMSDRICIASGGNIQVSLSADDLLSCCRSCGFGCNGGDPLSAWKFWVKDGIVTGSNHTMQQGCRPYPFPPCEHHSNKTHFQPANTSCSQPLSEDKFYGRSAYAVEADVQAIQNELYTNGPLEVAFEVYEDFMNYQGGVYFHQAGKLGGGHAVKLIGWGEEGGVPYWIVANSWNSDWGEDGFFRIVRGKDECGIESGVVGGLPDLQRSHSHYQRQNHHHHKRHLA
uniref:Peptidase C1A papain C-terminal domain-containing protein n=1 Tax=Ditylenchus dipsaci TaxID=166011 RepID=A0A915ERJ4_9BILA